MEEVEASVGEVHAHHVHTAENAFSQTVFAHHEATQTSALSRNGPSSPVLSSTTQPLATTKQLPPAPAAPHEPSHVVHFNVRGELFEVLRRTLQSFPDSLLAQLTRDDVMDVPADDSHAASKHRVIELDRDPFLFTFVVEVRA
jgi:hypothetical protein